MAEPFIGEITMFAGNFAPRGWALCDGQTLDIAQNSALFSILGTMYGGDGRTNFKLPDLRGRSPVHAGSGPGLPTIGLGQHGGVVDFTLFASQLPAHSHTASAISTMKAEPRAGTSTDPAGNMLAPGQTIFRPDSPAANVDLDTDMIATTVTVDNFGAGQSISKRSPFQGVNFIIALVGVFPSRS